MMNETILIIEDNEQNLYLMRFLLEKSGFHVLSATTGREGIELALRQKPKAILMDIQLPEMDGYQVLALLKGHEELASIPVIAVTSYAMAGDREKILASGADWYIEKPIDPASFVSDVVRYFSGTNG